MYDAVIVGGGPAGLSAALILGRCLREVLIIDHGRPRNAYSHKMHGFLSQHDICPSEFLELSKKQLSNFETVKYRNGEATLVKKIKNTFEVTLNSGEKVTSKKLLLATGVVDEVPAIDGIENYYGKSVFQCPYCDGYEVKGKKIAIYGKGDRGFRLSLTLKTWSPHIILCTDGDLTLTNAQMAQLGRNEVQICTEKIKSMTGANGNLEAILFEKRDAISVDAMFFNTPSFIRSRLLDQLGCKFSDKDGVPTGKYETTEVPGLFVAGNMTRDVQLVIVAAAEGAQAAFGINTELTKENIKP